MDAQTRPAKTPWLSRLLFFLKFLEIRLRFVAILIVTALLVGYWDWVHNYWERWTRGKSETAQAQSEWEFYCGMHPFVIRDRHGNCPVCGMTLDKRKRGAPVELPAGVLARVQVLPERVMQAGVQVEPVQHRLLSRTVRSYGIVEADETRVARIVARFPGRVEQLMVNAVGMEVRKGDPLARIYSMKYLGATLEFLSALDAKKRADADPQANAEAKRSAAAAAEGLRQRLALAGYTDRQLDDIAASGKADPTVILHSPLAGTVLDKKVLLGDTVDENMTLYTVADLSIVWVQIQVFESDLSSVRAGIPVEVTSVAWPGEIFYGTVDFLYPTVNPENRSIRARVIVANKDGKLKPGMYAMAAIESPVGRYGRVGTPDEPKPEPAAPAKPAADAYPLETCVVTGEKLGAMGKPVVYAHEGRTVKFCCAGCIATFKADPAKYLAVLDKAAQAKKAPAAEQYTCPMHPEVISDKPGDCPKCGMHLVKKEASKEPDPGGHWAEGYACAMHLDQLVPGAGTCAICGCGMKMGKWRVEKVLSIPELAVIDTGTRQYVFVEKEAGVYEARQVTLGLRAGSYYPVLAGVDGNSRVVARGSFLIDAEARLNPSTAAGLVSPSGGSPAKQPAGAAPATHHHGQ